MMNFQYFIKILDITDKNFSEIVKGSIWALSSRFFATILTMITSIIVARFYGAEIMGVVALLNSFLIFIKIFTVFGTTTSILSIMPEHIAKFSYKSAHFVYKRIKYLVIFLSIILGSIIFICSDNISSYVFSKNYHINILSLLSFFIIFSSLMDVNTQAVRGLRLIREFAFMGIFPSLFKLIILLILTIFSLHSFNPVYAMFASFFFTTLVGSYILNKEFKKRISFNDTVSKIPFKRIVSISFPMLLSSTMTFLIGQTGVLIIGIFKPEAEVGYYSISVRLATLTAFFLSSVNSIAAPKFSELFHNNKMDDLFRIAQKSAQLIFWSSLPILLILAVFGKFILSILYGNDFKIAYFPMLILIFGQFVNAISGSTGVFMNMTGNQIILRNIMVIAAIINLLGNIILTPKLGMYGAALSATFSITFWNIYILLYIRNRYSKNITFLSKS